MVSTTLSTLAVIAAGAAALVSQVDAHGYIISPKAQGNGIEHPGNFVIEYSPPWEGDWKDPKNFATAAKEKGFSTLRSYLEDKGAVCGFTDPNVSPRAIPTDRKVHFSRDIPHAVRSFSWYHQWLGVVAQSLIIASACLLSVGPLRALDRRHARVPERRLRVRVHGRGARVGRRLVALQRRVHDPLLLARAPGLGHALASLQYV